MTDGITTPQAKKYYKGYNPRTIMLKEADRYTAEAKKHYKTYWETTDEDEKKESGYGFHVNFGKACAIYDCMIALGIIDKSEEGHMIFDAYEKATGVKIQL